MIFFGHVRQFLLTFLKGGLMGTADAVPGISGGTVAFLIGIYDTLLAAIGAFNLSFFKELFSKNALWALKKIPWGFLIPLLLGIFSALTLLAKVLHVALNQELYRVLLYAFFSGLIAGSAYFCFKEIPRLGKTSLFFLLSGVVLGAYITNLETNADKEYEIHYDLSQMNADLPENLENYSSETKTLKGLTLKELSLMQTKGLLFQDTRVYHTKSKKAYFLKELLQNESMESSFLLPFFMGFLCAFAMLLPGISGSYVMLVFAFYEKLLEAYLLTIQALFQGNIWGEAQSLIAVFAMGFLWGIASCSRVIRYLFKHFYAQTFSLLTGFILGAMRALWPFWTYVYEFRPLKGPILTKLDLQLLPENTLILTLAIGLFIAAFLVIVAFKKLSSRV